MGQLIGQTAKRRVFRCIGTFLKSRHGPHHHRARTVPVPDHVIQRCDSCQMVMVIRIRIRILRLALPEIRLVETQIRVCTMWQQSPVQADWWLCLRPVATPWGETGLAGWQATRRTIQFNSIQFETEFEFDFNCQLPIGDVASNQRATCNLSLTEFIFGSTSE